MGPNRNELTVNFNAAGAFQDCPAAGTFGLITDEQDVFFGLGRRLSKWCEYGRGPIRWLRG
jgi:hypothetical protein